jgi:hypothetical protein
MHAGALKLFLLTLYCDLHCNLLHILKSSGTA